MLPWVWRIAENPSANSVVFYITGHPDYGMFSIHGLFISHTATTAKTYLIRTALRNFNDTDYQEIRDFFYVTVNPGSPLFIISEEHPFIPQIGTGAYIIRKERFEVIAVTGGEPQLSIGVYFKGSLYEGMDGVHT